MIEPGAPMVEVTEAVIGNITHWNGLNSNWENTFLSKDSFHVDPYSGNIFVLFKFDFKRRSQYFVMNLFGPVILLTFLEFIAFFITPQAIERTMYSATIMLAMFVIKTQILSYLPETPQPIIVAYYVIFVMAFCTCCTFYAAFMFWIISKC